jgi:MFS transporter, PPP family, 3-phenylpropionic acid transporter
VELPSGTVRYPSEPDTPALHRTALSKFVLLYTALYGAFGVISPFLPALLQDHGLAAEQVAAVMASGTAIRLVTGPLGGRFADQHCVWRGVLSACAAAAGAFSLLYLPARSAGVLLVVTLAQGAALASLPPIADALALSASASTTGKGFEYGWVRGAGSAAFILGSIAAGHWTDFAGLRVAVWLNALLLAATGLAALAVPAIAARSSWVRSKPHVGVVRDLLRIAAFRRLLLIAALVLGSHAFHDTFAVIRWRDAGISNGTASLLWSESVGAEVVVFFMIGPPLVHRLGAPLVMALAGAAGVVRWTVMGASTHVIALAMVEPLHGITFALLHLACMALIAAVVPSQFAATAQALYGAVAVGASTMLLTLGSGWLYANIGGQAFWAMAMLCAATLPLARRLQIAMAARTEAEGS